MLAKARRQVRMESWHLLKPAAKGMIGPAPTGATIQPDRVCPRMCDARKAVPPNIDLAIRGALCHEVCWS